MMKAMRARAVAIWAAVLVALVCSVGTLPRGAGGGGAAHAAVCLLLRAVAPVLSVAALAPELSLAERVGLHAVHALLEQVRTRDCAADAAAPPAPGEPRLREGGGGIGENRAK